MSASYSSQVEVDTTDTMSSPARCCSSVSHETEPALYSSDIFEETDQNAEQENVNADKRKVPSNPYVCTDGRQQESGTTTKLQPITDGATEISTNTEGCHNVLQYAQSSEHNKENHNPRDGFCCQLGVTIKRILILQIRSPCSYTCELLIPIIFVIGSIVLWAILGNDKISEADYFDLMNVAASDVAFQNVSTGLCYDERVSSGIGALMGCNALNASDSGDPLLCADPARSGTPPGLCVLRSMAAACYWGWKDLVMGGSTLVPLLDELLLIKWANRILFDYSDLKTVTDKSDGSAIFSTGRLLFTPDTADTKDLVSHLNATSTYFPYVYGGTMATEADAEDVVKQRRSSDPPNWGIIVVKDLNADAFDVSVRLNASGMPKTKSTLVSNYVGGIAKHSTEMYVFSGFMTLQRTIYDYYLGQKLAGSVPLNRTHVVPAPTVKYREQKLLASGGRFVSLILVLGFLYPVSQMTKRIVVEKELRLREAMLIMGLSEAVMYMAWLVIYAVQYLVVSVIMAVLMKVTYTTKSNYFTLFFLIFFFALSTVSLSGLIAAFFNQARLSSILAPIIYFVLAIPLFAIQDSKESVRTGLLLLSPSGFAVGLDVYFTHELAGGMHGSDITFSRDKPNMLVCLAVLFCDAVLYTVLMLYFDAVLPKVWGTRRHPLFFVIDPIRWCMRRGDRDDKTNLEDGRAEDGVFERDESMESQGAIRVAGLQKKYGSGKRRFTAVKNFHWTMREGEISVLLGHNGAGKTTVMNMMTGMTEPDKGDCFVYGKSVRTELAEARKQIGYCPQHNILWPELTCREHLMYYASIKGLRGEEREEHVERVLSGVDLQDKVDYLSKNLSGGQKRKLSVAIAFVGGSRLVFLDEPTAGMDVSARRHTWELLRCMSAHHSILLTTHFMDEADLLGDYIGIMSHGSLQYAGSSLFLKSQLGVGYVLTMSVVAHVDREPITNLLRYYVPTMEPLRSGAGEMSFRLPMAAKSAFPQLLARVESDGAALGVGAYTMSATTLEEIFIQIALNEDSRTSASEDAPGCVGADAGKSKTSDGVRGAPVGDRGTSGGSTEPHSVWRVELMTKRSSLMWSQFRAMILKRFWCVLRDRRTQFFQIVCPVACVLLAMLLTLVSIFQNPALEMSSGIYDKRVEVDVDASCTWLAGSLVSMEEVEVHSANVTGTAALSALMLTTYYRHPSGRERYSGLVCADAVLGGSPGIIYNSSALHELPLSQFHMYTAMVQQLPGRGEAVLRTVLNPMPRTHSEEKLRDAVYAMMVAVIIMIPFTFIPSTFVAWVVRERQCKARHLQNVSGLSFYIYWASNFVFDLACYLISMFLVIAVFAIFNRKEYIAGENIGATIVLFLLYGLSGMAMAYAVSFVFNDYSTAQNVVMLANFVVGFLLVLCITMLQLLESTRNAAKILRWIFRIVPPYCVGEGISNLAVLRMEEAFGTDKTAWSMSVVGWPCVYMAIEFPVFVFITLFIDHPWRRQRSQQLLRSADDGPEVISDEDPDVSDERDEVKSLPERQGDLVRVVDLRKVYPNGKVAVRNVTFGVKPGEVFGFLGTNGAGKTTTISILCQEFYQTSGDGWICGHDIVAESSAALRCIGYCPQFDATLELLSVEEHLYLYAGVRGVSFTTRERVVEDLMSLCELTGYRRTLSGRLSGGNRRKLSVALSLVGGPSVVFLDEPSAGMDPVARRGLWTAVETVSDNCSVVLTTHHLEEVEALAHRIAIMVDGTLRCIGNKTHLKQKFGGGFEIALRVEDEAQSTLDGVTAFFAEEFPGSVFREYRARRYTYEIPGTTPLSFAFKLLEENAGRLRVTDYSLSQTSIEQIFLQISEEAAHRAEQAHTEEIQARRDCCCGGCCA